MRAWRVVFVGVVLAVIVVSSGIAATRYLITSPSQISPHVQQSLRGGGYSAVTYGPPRTFTVSVSVRVPAGSYVASGGCSALRSDPHGTPLTFSAAYGYL